MSGRSGQREIDIEAGAIALAGDLRIPPSCRGIVAFAHGSGSSRRSTRNRWVAERLGARGCGTLLFDLLSEMEAADRRNVFDVPLLGRRVLAAVATLAREPATRGLPLGLFGASTGAAAALVAAADLGDQVAAVVSRGGRPDLAGSALERVTAPVLLIVGALDTDVLALNETAARRLAGTHELAIVPGAGHLFEEPGTLEQVADLAGDWFTRAFER